MHLLRRRRHHLCLELPHQRKPRGLEVCLAAPRPANQTHRLLEACLGEARRRPELEGFWVTALRRLPPERTGQAGAYLEVPRAVLPPATVSSASLQVRHPQQLLVSLVVVQALLLLLELPAGCSVEVLPAGRTRARPRLAPVLQPGVRCLARLPQPRQLLPNRSSAPCHPPHQLARHHSDSEDPNLPKPRQVNHYSEALLPRRARPPLLRPSHQQPLRRLFSDKPHPQRQSQLQRPLVASSGRHLQPQPPPPPHLACLAVVRRKPLLLLPPPALAHLPSVADCSAKRPPLPLLPHPVLPLLRQLLRLEVYLEPPVVHPPPRRQRLREVSLESLLPP